MVDFSSAGPGDNPQPRTGFGEAMAVFLAFAILGLAFSWPLAMYYLTGIAYGYSTTAGYFLSPMYEGDHLQYYYHLGLLKYAALGKIEWFTNPLEFVTPYQPKWPFIYSLPLSAVMYLPFTVVSLTFAYNTFMIVAIGLGGLGMYLWARELSFGRAAALAAGFVFDFFPLRQVELMGGHPSGFIMFLFPLSLYYFDRAIREKSATAGFMCGLWACILAIQYNFFAYFLFMFLMAYMPYRIIPAIWAAGAAAMARPLAPMGAGFLAAIGWMYQFKKTMVEESAMAGGRTWEEVANFSPPIWAAWSGIRGLQVYLGLSVGFVLLALALALLGRIEGGRLRRDSIFFLAIFLASYTLAFGASLDSYFPIYKLFYNHFPYFNLSRSPTKIMIISMACLAVLAAFSIQWAVGRAKPWIAAVAVFMLAVAYNYHPGKPVGICLLDQGNEAYRFIAKTGGGKPVLNIPIWPGESSWESIYQYYAIDSGTPMVNGYSPLVKKDYTDNVFWPLSPMNGGDVAEKQAKLITDLGVSYVVFHADAYPPKVGAFSPYFAIKRLSESPYLELVFKKDPLWVFKPRRPSGGEKPPTSSRLGSFFEAERMNWINGAPVEDKDASGGMALRAEPGKDLRDRGVIAAGPYATFPSGRYKAALRIKVEGAPSGPGPVARIDVAGYQGKTILAQRDILPGDLPPGGGYKEYEIEYTLDSGQFWQTEYRVFVSGSSVIWYDYAYVTAVGAAGPESRYEAEELRYYSGRLAEDPSASGGEAIRSTPGVNPEDYMVFGPQAIFDEGRWRATVRLKSDADTGANPAGTVDVWIGAASKPAIVRKFTSAGLGGPGKWGEVAVEFSLPRRTMVEVAVMFGGKAPLSVDYVSFEKTAGAGVK